MPQISELKGVEKPVAEWLSKMGWAYKSLEDLHDYHRPFSNPIIDQILLEKIKEFNGLTEVDSQSVMDTLIQNLNNPTPIDGNEKFLERLVKEQQLMCKVNRRTVCILTLKIFGETIL